jgi:hypothetical protein
MYKRAILIVLAIGILTGLSQTVTNTWSKRIRSKTVHPLSSLLNPHVSEFNLLTIDGKRFEHVRGEAPFYISVPHTNMIVFVVDEQNHSITYHVFNMDSGTDIAIPSRGSIFGYDIGFSHSCDSAEDIRDGKLTLLNIDKSAKTAGAPLTNLYRMKSYYCLDLVNRSVCAEKKIYYDDAGNVTNEWNGKPPF